MSCWTRRKRLQLRQIDAQSWAVGVKNDELVETTERTLIKPDKRVSEGVDSVRKLRKVKLRFCRYSVYGGLGWMTIGEDLG